MVKQIKGQLWFCCPKCGQKLHEITREANCHGVLTYCKKCKQEILMEIKAERGRDTMASIRKMEGKGGVSYKITVSMGRDAQDKQIRHFKTWKPDRPMTTRQMEKEVQRVALDFEREITLGFRADNRQTFAQYAAYVYGLQEQRGDKPQTLHRIKRQTARINEHIGHMKLADIRPQHLTALYKKLSEPGKTDGGFTLSPPWILTSCEERTITTNLRRNAAFMGSLSPTCAGASRSPGKMRPSSNSI